MTSVRFRILAITTAMSVLLYLDRICIGTLKTDFTSALELSDWQSDFITGAFFWSYALAQVPSGWLADRFGARKMVTLYIVSWSLFTLSTGLAMGFVALAASRLLCGIAQAGAYPAAAGLIRRWAHPTSRGAASGVVAVGGRVGGAVAPVLTGVLQGVPMLTWRGILGIYGSLGAIVGFAYFSLVRDRPREHPGCNGKELAYLDAGAGARSAESVVVKPSAGETLSVLRRMIFNFSMWCNCAAQFGTNIGWAFLVTKYSEYLEKVHLLDNSAERGLYSTIPLLCGIPGMFLGGFVTDWAANLWGKYWGRNLPIVGSRLIAAGAVCVCLFTDNLFAETIAFSCVAFFTDLGVPSTWAFVQDVGGRHTGTVLGWGNMWGNFGAGLSPMLMGEVIGQTTDPANWDRGLIVCAAGFILSAVTALGMNAARPVAPEDAEA